MDGNYIDAGHRSAVISVILGVGAFITPETINWFIRGAVAIGSIGTAIMAIRYYYWATKEKQQNIQLNNKKNDG